MTVVRYLYATRLQMLSLWRLPAYWVPTLIFPGMLFVMFGSGGTAPRADYQMASFILYGMLGVAFFQFGVSIAMDRESRWERYRRTLSGSFGPRVSAQIFSAVLFSLGTSVVVVSVAHGVSAPTLGAGATFAIIVMVLIISTPFTLLGIALGYWTNSRSAVAVANLLYLPLAYLGGLWMPPERLPEIVKGVSLFTPTRHGAEIVWFIVDGRPFPVDSILWLIGFSVLFGACAYWGYRRDEGTRYA